eukprot:364208-Chlamydomonas_euryale.AAC.6
MARHTRCERVVARVWRHNDEAGAVAGPRRAAVGHLCDRPKGVNLPEKEGVAKRRVGASGRPATGGGAAGSAPPACSLGSDRSRCRGTMAAVSAVSKAGRATKQ